MEKTTYEEISASKRQNLRKSMEILKAEHSGLLTRIPQLKDLLEHNELVEANIEERSRELELKAKELQISSLDLEQKRKLFEEEKAEASNPKKLVEEETDRKKKELALILDKIKEYGKQFVTVDEQLESGRRLLEMQSLELVSKEKELECVRESIKLYNSDLELKEKKVESLNNFITVCGKEIDSKSEQLGKIQKVIEQQTYERDSIKLFIQELSEELVLKEKRHEEILEIICRSSSEMEERAKEIKASETKISDLNLRSKRFRQEVESKEKELNLLKNQIQLEEKKLFQFKREMEEETYSKKKDLSLINSKIEESSKQLKALKAAEIEASDLNQRSEKVRQEVEGKKKELDLLKNHIELEEKKLFELEIEMEEETYSKKKDLLLINSKIEESGKQLAAVDELVELQRRRLEIQSMELISKDMELECVCESSKRFEFEIEVKEKRVKALDDLLKISSERLDLKSKELEEIQKLIRKQPREVGVMHKQHNSMKLSIRELSELLVAKEKQLKEILEAICRSSFEMESTKTEASNLSVKSQRLRREVEDREKELNWLKNQVKSEENELTRLNKSIQDCKMELSSRKDQVEAMKKIQRELLKKQLIQTSSLLVEDATETDPVIEDALTHPENSIVLKRNEVSTVLRDSLNPAEFVLELVQGKIREELDLHDLLVTNWILLFEELAKIQRSVDPQVQLKARQLATLWKKKITIEAPKSSLEVLAFLLFIVTYRLKTVINEEETALLASSIARYEQAPELFDSLSLKCDIREFVEGCIKESQYIPAVRLICLFKLNTELSPSELLVKEINNLRQSSQAKDKDAGKLRAILELVAAYKLEIDLPGDLVAKLVVQREYSTPPVAQCNVKYGNSSSNLQANSPNLASASTQRSSVNLRVPKLEVKSELNL